MASIPIQIVDEHDNPIGEASTLEAQEKGLIHRIVRIMAEDDQGRILLQKRGPAMVRWPNCWDNSAAGHVDVGEDYLVAAKRELEEELGISGVELKEVDTYYTDRPLENLQLRRFNRLYKISFNGEPPRIEPKEVSEVKWCTVEEVRQLIKDHPDQVTDGLNDVISRYYAEQ